MKNERELYELSRKIVACASKRDKIGVDRLSRKMEGMIPYHRASRRIALHFDYENLRQSCVMALNVPEYYRGFIADAQKRLMVLPMPRESREQGRKETK